MVIADRLSNNHAFASRFLTNGITHNKSVVHAL